MVLGIGEEFVEEPLRLVADVAVVLLVEALGEDGVGKFALVAPVVLEYQSRVSPLGLEFRLPS